MEKAKISVSQLYAIMVIFNLGSSTVFGLGAEAKQDAWISIIIGCILGILLFLLYGVIIKKYPDLTLIEIFKKVLGNTIGKILSYIYILYFIFFSSLLIRDIFELLSLYVMTETPIIILALVSIMIISYATYLGIETIARFGFIIFIITMPLKVTLNLLTYISGLTNLQNILPILENGWSPVFSSAFPLITNTSFGQMFIFLMLIPYVNKKEKVIKTGVFAILTSGIILFLITITNILTLGPLFIELTVYPTIQTIRLINIMNVLQRIEGFAVFTFLTCSYMKAIIYIYTVTMGCNILFNSTNYKKYILPTVIIALFSSLIYTENLSTHLKFRRIIFPKYIVINFEIFIPVIIIIIILSRKYIKMNRDKI